MRGQPGMAEAKVRALDEWWALSADGEVWIEPPEVTIRRAVAAAYPVIAKAVLDGLGEWVELPERNLRRIERQIIGACVRTYARELTGGNTDE